MYKVAGKPCAAQQGRGNAQHAAEAVVDRDDDVAQAGLAAREAMQSIVERDDGVAVARQEVETPRERRGGHEQLGTKRMFVGDAEAVIAEYVEALGDRSARNGEQTQRSCDIPADRFIVPALP
jgi:hypothetical protein